MTPAHADATKLAKGNSGVDLQQLCEVQDVIRQLRKSGIEKKGYSLDAPYSRTGGRFKKPASADPRAVFLK